MRNWNGWSEEAAGMAQLMTTSAVMQKSRSGWTTTPSSSSTDNGTELFTRPDGGTTPFAQSKGTVMEGGFRVPCIRAGPPCRRTRSERHLLRLGLVPTFLAAAGNPNITEQLLKGVKLGDRTYKNHLTATIRWLPSPAKGPSARHEIFTSAKAPLARCA
jgi:arylsulfatase